MVQLSYAYMTIGKTIALTRQTFVDKVMSLLFNTQSRFIIAFLLRSKYLLILWLQSPSAVILEPKRIKSLTVTIVNPSICHEVMRRYHDLSFLNVEFKASFFTLLFHLHQEALSSFFAFCHKGGVICIPKLLIFPPAILIPGLCSIQFSISHDVICIYIK